MKNLRKKKLTKYAKDLILPWEEVVLPSIETGNFPHGIQAIHNSLSHLVDTKPNDLFVPNYKDKAVESLAFFSDYGGEHKGSKYLTYSFVVTIYQTVQMFSEKMKSLREKYGMSEPYKELSFKGLNYGPAERMLPEYLKACSETVMGTTFTIVVDKEVSSFLGSNLRLKEIKKIILKECDKFFPELTTLIENVPPVVLEKQLTIIHLLAYLVSWLAEPHHKIFWQTDNDKIIANEKFFELVQKLVMLELSRYSSNEYPLVGLAQPFEDNRQFNDLLSIPDLICGSLEHYLSRHKKSDDQTNLTVKSHAHEILVWLSKQGILLKHLMLKLEYSEKGVLQAVPFTINFHLPVEESSILYI